LLVIFSFIKKEQDTGPVFVTFFIDFYIAEIKYKFTILISGVPITKTGDHKRNAALQIY